jgi:signal transduction histidine kinase
MENNKKKFRPIRAKLTLAIIIISSLITIVIIIFNIYEQYSKDLRTLDEKIFQVRESALPSISRVVWNLDIPALEVQTESIAQIKDLVKVVVLDPKGQTLAEKFHSNHLKLKSSQIELLNQNLRTYKFPLYHRGLPDEYIGTVEIVATTVYIKNEIFNRQLIFVTGEIIKTVLLSFLIILIINYYINHNLNKIIEFLKRFNPDANIMDHLDINRKSKTTDEMDILQNAINQMISQIRILNKEKEQIISDQEKKIEIQQMAAINSAKMAALGEMAGGIAHEINNPLTIINTHALIMTKTIEKGNIDPTLLLKSSQNIASTVERIGTIIHGLKNISRDVSSEQITKSPFKNILVDVIALCEEKFKLAEIEIQCNVMSPQFDVSLNCFQVQLSQVFLNLFNNSYDAILNLDTKWIRIEAKTNGPWYIIHFIDSGNGIPLSIRDKIFQPFFTSKEIGSGTGLGLSLVYGIIKNHKGEIYYDNQNKNTCFTIKLPIEVN